MRRLRRSVPAVLAVALAGSGVTIAASPGHASSVPTVQVTPSGPDQGSDWGDGAAGGHGVGRMGPRAARTTTVNPASGPDFELPFVCGQRWTGSSRAGHSPSYYAIDWNTSNDLGRPALASAPGVVITARTLSGSYGRYVVIDHGNGYSTLYGHLNQIVATVGTYVDQGDLIGYVGSSGNSTGPHLHFEERLNGAYFPPYFHRATFKMGTALTATCNDRPLIGDWDGDGVSDLGLFRNAATSGQFFERAGGAVSRLLWGHAGDVPVAGDFDGDHLAQVGVRQLSGAAWQLRSRTGTAATVAHVGTAADTPLTGDWDGNGRANLGYYRGSTHQFFLRAESGAFTTVALGAAGSRPVVGDWNGDGVTDLGVYDPVTRTWTLRTASHGSVSTARVVFGGEGDAPIAGDWNGDGTDDLGLWRPATSGFIERRPTAVQGRYTNLWIAFGNPR